MTLNDILIFSQITAAVLVVPSVLYLAMQVRQNTKQLKAAATYQFVEATGQMNAVMAGSKALASVFRRGTKHFDSLDKDERWQYFFFLGQHMQIHSVMFELHQSGLLPETQWHNVWKDILTMIRSDGGRRVWEDFARGGLDPAYVAFVENLVASAEVSYNLNKVGEKRQ